MGSSTLIDILSSMLIGGLLFLVALRMNDQATSATFQCEEELTVQENLTDLVEVLESDFRKIGYNSNPLVPFNNGQYIEVADTSDIKFVADLDNSGNYSTVEWKLNKNILNKASGARELDRIITDPKGNVTTYSYASAGVTTFLMQYYDKNVPVDTLTNLPIINNGTNMTVQTIQLTLSVVPTAAYDTAYSSSVLVWRQKRLASMNLKKGR